MLIEKDYIYFSASDQTAKQLDAVWVKSRNAWRVPNTLGALRELYKSGYDVAEYGKQKSTKKAELLAFKTITPPVIDTKLRPYQNQDIHFLSFLPHSAIFNEQRTGEQI